MRVARWLATVRNRMGFVLLFAAYLALLGLLFDHWQAWLGAGYLYPLSWVTARALALLGLPATLDAGLLGTGTCALIMEPVVFHITYDCAGVFALLVYVAAVLAQPTTPAWRAVGLLGGGAAMFAYGVVRLLVLALVGHLAPSWLSFLHAYLLVLMNVGFVLVLWATWVARAPSPAPARAR